MAVPSFNGSMAVKDIPWGDKTQIENAILGPSEDWGRYQKAHLWFDPKNRESKAGYKLPFARMDGGSLVAVRSQLSAAIAALNGARGGVAIPPAERQAAYNLAVRYLKKFDPKIKVPELKGSTMRKLDAEGFIEYTTTGIAKAHKEGDTEALGLISTAVDTVSKAKAEGKESVVVKGYEGQEEIEIQIAARTGDGTPPIGDPIDEKSASGQGIASNVKDLAKGEEGADENKGDDGDKTNKGDDDGNAATTTDDDGWPDDLNAPNPKGKWGDDPK